MLSVLLPRWDPLASEHRAVPKGWRSRGAKVGRRLVAGEGSLWLTSWLLRKRPDAAMARENSVLSSVSSLVRSYFLKFCQGRAAQSGGSLTRANDER